MHGGPVEAGAVAAGHEEDDAFAAAAEGGAEPDAAVLQVVHIDVDGEVSEGVAQDGVGRRGVARELGVVGAGVAEPGAALVLPKRTRPGVEVIEKGAGLGGGREEGKPGDDGHSKKRMMVILTTVSCVVLGCSVLYPLRAGINQRLRAAHERPWPDERPPGVADLVWGDGARRRSEGSSPAGGGAEIRHCGMNLIGFFD